MLGSDYTADDGLGDDGRFAYAYAHRHRRIMKRVERFDGEEWRTGETHAFAYDGCNIVLERIAFADGSTRTVEYFWGNDLSGTEQGAGGVGGLVAVCIDGAFFILCYDHNGNVVCYVSESGAVAAQYVYDPYGNVIEQHGGYPDLFNFGFSTKYLDRETGMLSYQRRFYRPDLGRWLNRDPIEEEGGDNLYEFVCNRPAALYDRYGLRMGYIGPNVVDSGDGHGVGWIWLAIFGESWFSVHRKIIYDLKNCDSGRPLKQTYDYFSVPKQNRRWDFVDDLSGEKRSMAYEEILSISAESLYEHCGSLSVLLEVTHHDTKSPSQKSAGIPIETEGFGTEQRNDKSDVSNHPVTNFNLDDVGSWIPSPLLGALSFTVKIDCEGVKRVEKFTARGKWELDGRQWLRLGEDGNPRPRGR